MSHRRLTYRPMIIVGLIFIEILLIFLLNNRKKPVAEVDWLTAYGAETDEFRAMEFGPGGLAAAHTLADQWEVDVYHILAAQLVSDSARRINASQSKEQPSQWLSYREYQSVLKQLETEKPVEWMKLVNSFQTVLGDLRYFPVAVSGEDGLSGISYENGWGDPRTYGGDRLHEGTDLMDNQNIRGSFPIVSMSDGVVEHIGWLEKGGYRIGIRSPGGAYLYYAHLAWYAEEFTVGESVKAGQLLGFMGDTGYSTVEGTVGNFPVHLHLGIYLQTDHFDELSVNPYYILKYLENNTVSYAKESHLWYNFIGCPYHRV